jgi:O-antigen ligase
VNRNHFATWVIMAMPLCLGYLAARQPIRASDATPRITLDSRATWILLSLAIMLLALLLSLSRSGMLGLAVASVGTLLLTRTAMGGWYFRRLGAVVALVTLLAVSWADLPAIRERLVGVRGGLANRLVIWDETLPMVQQFWLTGVGTGAYETAMRVYQQSDRAIYFNQAHSHYLQVVAEGGALVTIPLLVAALTFVRTARQRLQRDNTTVWRIRVGAACGLAAVALQSVWETGLTMTANSALAAVLAGILVCERRPRSKPPKRTRRKSVRVEERQADRRRDAVPAADDVSVRKQVLTQKGDTGPESS